MYQNVKIMRANENGETWTSDKNTCVTQVFFSRSFVHRKKLDCLHLSLSLLPRQIHSKHECKCKNFDFPTNNNEVFVYPKKRQLLLKFHNNNLCVGNMK